VIHLNLLLNSLSLSLSLSLTLSLSHFLSISFSFFLFLSLSVDVFFKILETQVFFQNLLRLHRRRLSQNKNFFFQTWIIMKGLYQYLRRFGNHLPFLPFLLFYHFTILPFTIFTSFELQLVEGSVFISHTFCQPFTIFNILPVYCLLFLHYFKCHL
jgi:hypothetical protein